MLALVEGMPLESLREGVPWGTWKTFGEWLNTFAGSLAINAGFMVGHSTIRRLAMGEDAYNPNPTEAQLKTMETYLREQFGRGRTRVLQLQRKKSPGRRPQPRPVTLGGRRGIRPAGFGREGVPGDEPRVHPPERGGERRGPDDRHVQGGPAAHQLERARGDRSRDLLPWRHDLAVSDRASTDGARIVALENPARKMSRRSFATSFGFNTIPDWGPVFALPPAERVRALGIATSGGACEWG